MSRITDATDLLKAASQLGLFGGGNGGGGHGGPRSHRYVKRTGAPGHYQYTYQEPMAHRPGAEPYAAAAKAAVTASHKARVISSSPNTGSDVYRQMVHEAHADAGHAHTDAMTEAHLAGDEKAAALHKEASDEHHTAALEANPNRSKVGSKIEEAFANRSDAQKLSASKIAFEDAQAKKAGIQTERVTSKKGGTVELHHRDGKVVGASGQEPQKYVGQTLEDAKRAHALGVDPRRAAKAGKKSPKAQATHAAKTAEAAEAKEDAVDHAHGLARKATQLSIAANRLSSGGGERSSANHQAEHEAHKAAGAAHREAAEAFKKPGAGVSIGGKSFASLHEDRAKMHEEKAGDSWAAAVKARSAEQGETFGQAATHKVGGEAKTSLDKHHDAVADLQPKKMRTPEHFERAHAKIKALHDHLEEKLGFHPATAHARKALNHSREAHEDARHIPNMATAGERAASVKRARGLLADAQEHAKSAFEAADGHRAFQKSETNMKTTFEGTLLKSQDRTAGPPARSGVYDALGAGIVAGSEGRPRYAGLSPNQVIGVGMGGTDRGSTLAYMKPRQAGGTLELAKSAIVGALKDGYRLQLTIAEANPTAQLVKRANAPGARPTVPVELRKSMTLPAPDPETVVAYAAEALAKAAEQSPQLKEGLSRLGVSRRTLREAFAALAFTPEQVAGGY